MIIRKILNNNVITSNSEDGQEIIIVGNGIGWKQKVGEEVDQQRIDKIFRMDTASSTARLKQLFLSVRMESIQASSEIVDYARKTMGVELKKNVYITLTDHIDFAIERYEKGIVFKNALLWQIRKIYYREFEIGSYALKIIHQHFGIQLSEDEAAAIAMHLVNAEFDGNMAHTESMISIIQKSVDMVEVFLEKKLDPDSLDYQRFVTHLLFFAQRIADKKALKADGDFLTETIQRQYPQAFRCARKIADYVQNEYEIEIGAEEVTFLTVHIVRLAM